MAYQAPKRTPQGVAQIWGPFICDARCDYGRVPAGTSPNSEGYARCEECCGAGRYSSIRCSECNDLVEPRDVRSIDHFYIYCEQCSEKLCAPGGE